MSPRNLLLTKAELTDEPYKVQLEVLRWIKRLVSSLVDSAVLAADDGNNASTRHHSSEGVVASSAAAADDSQGKETSGCFKEDCVEANGEGERASVGQMGEGDGRRKRAKILSQEGEQEHAVGSVVECFHAVRWFSYDNDLRSVYWCAMNCPLLSEAPQGMVDHEHENMAPQITTQNLQVVPTVLTGCLFY